MLESYLCGLCRRNCKEADRERCLSNPSLNLGCGMMLQSHSINFDYIEQRCNNMTTDIIGRIENICEIFKPDTFNSIFCAHVIEHFLPQQGRQMVSDCLKILKPQGVLVVEGPDIEKIIHLYNNSDIGPTIQEIYGDPKYGDAWMHKWGWTGKLAEEQMRRSGFNVRYCGDGTSHNKPERDFRVEGVKP